MSDQTFEALEQAIHEHIADEHGSAHTTGWVLVLSHVTADDFAAGRTGYQKLSAEGQPFHVTAGLMEVGNLITGDMWTADDEDD